MPFLGLFARVIGLLLPFGQAFWPVVRILMLGMLAGVAFKSMWEAFGRIVTCWINQWLCSLLRVVLEQSVPVLKPVFEQLGQLGQLDLSLIIQWWLLFDYYFPATEFVLSLGSTTVFVMAFRTFRLAKQFFPTWSN